MKLKQWLRKRGLRIGLCLILVFAIVAQLCWPGLGLEVAEAESPTQVEQISEIDHLHLGESDNDADQEELQETAESQAQESESEEEESETEDPDETGTEEPENEEPETEEPENEEPENEETEPQENESDETEMEEEGTENDDHQTEGTGEGADGPDEEQPGTTGDETAVMDIAMVMTWYQYGVHPQNLVCVPSEVTQESINTAKLENNELKYEFSMEGTEKNRVESFTVQMKAGDDSYTEISESGTVPVRLPGAGEERSYTFLVTAKLKESASEEDALAGEQEVTFTYVLNCHYAMDLEMELTWEKGNGSVENLVCEAEGTVEETISRKELSENIFNYKVNLNGTLADGAQIINGEYHTSSGTSGSLNAEGGSILMQLPEGADKEIYYLTFEAKVEGENTNAQNIFFHFTLHFADRLDLELSFTWLERGMVPRTLNCQMDQSVSVDVKNNQLSAGALKYEVSLIGEDSANARILNLTYTSEASGGGAISESGALPLTIPDGYTSNNYVITALVLAEGKQTEFKIVVNYSMDVNLEMQYTVLENGAASTRTVVCENGKSKTAEVIYDDQLPDGLLSYRMSTAGQDASALTITSVTCYQSGAGNTVSLSEEGTLTLLLKNGKTGENTFRITAADESGTEYEFQINVPYKHRGENIIKITSNLTDGQVVTNDADLNLRVNAWTEDESGTVTGYIPANGTDTKLIVTLNDKEISYVSTSGSSSEYTLHPENPETGDNNTHTLNIYAEDAYGNFGELNLLLNGQRNEAGQRKGTATIYVDLSVLGLGVVGSLSYEVLADEPVSYAVAKGVLGMDTGEPFGAAANSLGWSGSYAGTLDTGFYLQRLSTGYSGNALSGSSWNQYGSSEKEILEAIDNQFGKGSGLATLWRCIYRNGLNKSAGSGGSQGEFDYTSGSGWMFSLDGAYYPGQSMSQWTLQDGDVLTLRYTLAYGWDVGGGVSGYGNTVGYCVSASNGGFNISHRMTNVQNEDGSTSYICQCCGLEEGCAHSNKIWKDLEDGTHIEYCEDCQKEIGDPKDHIWEKEEEKHVCSECEASEEHIWEEVEESNTATCTEPGVRTMKCRECEMEKEEDSPAKGHSLDSRWNHTNQEHYQKCSVCEETIEESRGRHQYKYHSGDNDWYCEVCDAGHDWDYCGNSNLQILSSTCLRVVYFCNQCSMELVKEGSFAEYHSYANGACVHCGGQDPNFQPSQPEISEPVVPDPEPVVPDPEPVVPDPEPVVPDPEPVVPDPVPEGEV